MPSKTIAGGRLIFFEGIDGVGKTTQLQRVKAELQNDGWLVEDGRIHGTTPISEALRQVSLSDLPRPVETDLYMSLAMHQSLIQQVNSWRKAGAIVLIDRSPISIIAYQAKGDGLPAEMGWAAVEQSMAQFKPDLTIIYTAAVPVALNRAKQKPGWADYFSTKPSGYFDEAQSGYLEAAKRYKALVIDAGQPEEAVYQLTIQNIKTVLEA